MRDVSPERDLTRSPNDAHTVVALQHGDKNVEIRGRAASDGGTAGNRDIHVVGNVAEGIDSHIGWTEEGSARMIARNTVHRCTKRINRVGSDEIGVAQSYRGGEIILAVDVGSQHVLLQ